MSSPQADSIARRRPRIELFFFLIATFNCCLNPARAFSTNAPIWTQNQRSVPTELYGFSRTKKNPKRSKEKNFRKLTSDNDLLTNHKERLATAGKEGTLRYTDPTLVFIGNLNFTATEEHIKSLVLPIVPSPWDISKVQVVRDWKTGESKGYAFVRFTEPIFATLCLQQLNQKEYLGRRLEVKAAKSKSESPLRQKQREEQARLKALRRAENPPKPQAPKPKRENPEFLAALDSDLIIPSLDDVDDDDDDEVDGWEDPNAPAPKGFGEIM